MMTSSAVPERAAPPPPPAPTDAEGAPVHLPHGLPGFPDAKRFRLEPMEGTGGRFVRLRSLDVDGPCFMLTLDPVEAPLLAAEDVGAARRDAGLGGDDLVVLFVVTLQRNDGALGVFVNRRAPVLIDGRTGVGAQVVLPRPGYQTRHRLFDA